jgi:hypothetical protein
MRKSCLQGKLNPWLPGIMSPGTAAIIINLGIRISLLNSRQI